MKHEVHCPAATGPRPSLLPAEHNDDSGFETAPESAASPAGGTEIQAGRPDRARRMQRMLRRREVAWRSSLVLLVFFGLWRGVLQYVQVLLFVPTTTASLRSALLDRAGVVGVEAGIARAKSRARVLAVHPIDQTTAPTRRTKIEKVP